MSQVRAATTADIPELVRLRALLFERMEQDLGPPADGADWRKTCAEEFRVRLGEGTLGAFVVDGANGRLAACGIGLLDRRLPGPYTPTGRWGHISGMVTDPAHRRRGHARAIMHELLRWFRDQGVRRVELHATSDAEPLYRSLGFAEHPEHALTWRDAPR
ncbi:MAG TPA: GNAT family N-acetyltransferase [Streptosporangiaceae bacterium]|jgi:GNAT superfamily N-acetyltransferase